MCLAAVQVVLFVLYQPSMVHWLWPKALAYMEEHQLSQGKFYFCYGLFQSYLLVTLINGFYSICYWFEFPFMERYKVLEEPWPWNDDKEAWNKLFWRTFFLYGFNACVIGPLVYCPFYAFDLEVLLDFSVEGIPSSVQMVAQVFLCMLLEDFTFHFSHRMLHHKAIYPYVHKIHHEHKVTIGWAAQHAHPLEFVFGNLLPAAAGPILLGKRMHFATAFTWYTLRFIESAEGHSGYEFSWSPFRVLPFASDFGYHAYHHSHNIGNYSSFFTIWDTVFGSNETYYRWKEQESLASKDSKKD